MGVQTQTRFDTNLNGAITDVQTTSVLNAAPAQTTGFGTFERGLANEEDVYWGGVAGLQLTDMLRGLSQTALTVTEVGGNKKAHADNATFEGTLLHYIINNKADVDDAEVITGDWDFTIPPELGADPTDANDATRKSWIDTQLALKANLAGGNVFSGNQVFADNTAQSTTDAAPNADKIFANKKYVDDQVAAVADFPQPLATAISDVTASAAEINTALDGISANVTAANLTTLTGGGDASELHEHYYPTRSFVAAEAITAGQNLCLMPHQVEWFSPLTAVDLAIGDFNVRRKYYVKYIPKANESFTTTNFRAREAVNGATATGNMIVSWQTESGGAPSGTAVANGSVTITQATQRTWTATMGSRTATHAGTVNLTKGTTYYLVWEVSSTDPTNFIYIGENSSFDENYPTFTRGTYNLDTLSWGSTVTNATPFFWVNTLSGMGVAPTDADFGGRAWGFAGVAKANAAAEETVKAYCDVVPGLSLTLGRNCFVSQTAGAITQTPITPSLTTHTACYKIGRPISGSEMKIELGRKEAWGNINGTSTTTSNLICWFPWRRLRIDGGTDANSVYLYSSSENSFASSYEVHDLSDGSGDNYGSSAAFWVSGAGHGYTGAISNQSSIGATLTMTKQGTSVGFSANVLFTE